MDYATIIDSDVNTVCAKPNQTKPHQTKPDHTKSYTKANQIAMLATNTFDEIANTITDSFPSPLKFH